ncbi:f-box/WD repeat-containing protein 7-like isoform 1 [Planoprotostelium fungivorum]|uniref:F-box/WD repeat-containing protein 7-like isoform 1 n=1 Tax=Planoprotostelium fungivorum TaxID=1890364 RepID=A0A2P6N8C8_9EUKA|nr:f-box/WD repeat-containing protein 7-like isoform 1 [Planoprotostelium fungivorum]
MSLSFLTRKPKAQDDTGLVCNLSLKQILEDIEQLEDVNTLKAFNTIASVQSTSSPLCLPESSNSPIVRKNQTPEELKAQIQKRRTDGDLNHFYSGTTQRIGTVNSLFTQTIPSLQTLGDTNRDTQSSIQRFLESQPSKRSVSCLCFVFAPTAINAPRSQLDTIEKFETTEALQPNMSNAREPVEVSEPLSFMKTDNGTAVRSLTYKDDNLYILHNNNAINIWDQKKNAVSKELKMEGKVHMMELRMDFLYIALDKSITTWEAKTRKFLKNQNFQGHTEWITRFAIAGAVLYTASNDKTVKAWNIKDGQCMATYKGHKEAVSCMEVFGSILVTGSVDRSLRLWRAAREGKDDGVVIESTAELVGHTKMIFNVKLFGSTVYSASMDGTIRIWDAKSGTPLHVHKIDAVVSGFRVDFKLNNGDDTYIWSSEKHTIHTWNIKNGKFGAVFNGHRSDIKCMKRYSDYLFSGSEDRDVRQWSIKDGNCLMIIRNSTPVTALTFVDNKLFAGGDDGNIRMWSLAGVSSDGQGDLEEKEKKSRSLSNLFKKSPRKGGLLRASAGGSQDMKQTNEVYSSIMGKNDDNSPTRGNARIAPSFSNSSVVETQEDEELVGWYMGQWSREKAEEMLMKRGVDCLVVRSSSIPGCFALTKYFGTTKTFQHLLIITNEGRYLIKDSFDHSTYRDGRIPVGIRGR